MPAEREIFRSQSAVTDGTGMMSNTCGLVVMGTAGGGVRFVVFGSTHAELSGADRWRLVSALTAWASAGAADEHLERVARLSTAAVG